MVLDSAPAKSGLHGRRSLPYTATPLRAQALEQISQSEQIRRAEQRSPG